MSVQTAIPALPPRPARYTWLYLVLWCVSLGWIVYDLELSGEYLATAGADMLEYFSRYSRPDLSELPLYLALMGQTLAMALWGTLIALILAVLLTPFAASTLTPNRWLYQGTREVLNVLRALPDLLLALMLVAAVGLGPLPGVLALGLHTAGFLGKFFAENMERVERTVYEGVRSTGANFVQVTLFAAWPMTLREAVGYTLYILDRNVRMASVLGLVGAGGIGTALYDALRIFEYSRAAGLMLVILTALLLIDGGTTWIRNRLR
jgi:phosphonate transport system permease protein